MVDWIFFYSKKGVEFFFKGLETQLSPTIRLASMGTGTANKLTEYGYQANFIGTGLPEDTAQLFLRNAASQKVLFPRAKTSMRSIQTILEQQIKVYDLVVYDNTTKRTFQIPKVDCLTFTSPLNVSAYFSKYPYEGQFVVAIGPTTAKALQALNIPHKTALKPTEKALILALLDI